MRYSLHVKVFFLKMKTYTYHSKYKSNFHAKYLWENWQTTGSFLSLKKNFHKNFSMWKVITKWMFIATLINLQFYTQMGKSFFRTDISSKTGTLMRLMKNLVTIPSSLWTRYLIKVIQRFALTWHCIDKTLH